MNIKVCPVCPTCRAPHDRVVEPGTKVKCPDCDQVYRAEAAEGGGPVAGPRDRSAGQKAARTQDPPAKTKKAPPEEAPAKKKKPRAKKSGDLGKVIERFAPGKNKAAILSIAIIAGILAAVVTVVALVVLGKDARPFGLGGAGVLLLVAAVCALMLMLGGSSSFFEVCKKGVRYKTRRTEQYLFWEEIENISIQRVIQGPGKGGGSVKYEVHLVGSETIHLTNSFLGSLENPSALIKSLKRYSGQDFDTVFE
jgi:hypothetical protein